MATPIFRIVQEALTNVARHARASRVELVVEHGPDSFALSLRDNGVGLDVGAKRQGSIGLFSMAERARDIGASLQVRACLAGGTELKLHLPLPAVMGVALA